MTEDVQENPFRAKSEHQKTVEEFLTGMGKPVPDAPRLALDVNLRSQLSVQLEEFLELVEACGYRLHVTVLCTPPTLDLLEGDEKVAEVTLDNLTLVKTSDPDLVEIADATADVAVTNTGMMSINGIADLDLLEEVDQNNLLKLEHGTRCPKTGKLLKPKNHPKPDIKSVLGAQGWQQETDDETREKYSGRRA